mmetsp:Transcript_5842/g.10506  ORF Transcript_5842/g.10506 Transcript_5842/m.10506 type:complete len:200 (-) Transcript_5842:1085-1684(-)
MSQTTPRLPAPTLIHLVVLHRGNIGTWVVKLARKSLHISLQVFKFLITLQTCHEIGQLLASLLLDLQSDLNSAVQKVSHLSEIFLLETTGGQGRSTNTHTARIHGTGITVNSVFVQGNRALVKHLLRFGSGESCGSQIPKHQVIVRSISHQLVSVLHQLVCQCLRVQAYLLNVLLEFWGLYFPKLNCQCSNLMIMWTTL